MEKKEITTEQEIKLLVDTFYGKVNQDALLSPVFNDEAKVNWPEHLPKMYAFWGTQLLHTGDYRGQPFPPHMKLHVNHTHFERWVKLFTETVDELFYGEVAESAKNKARNIAVIFQEKINFLKNGGMKQFAAVGG